MKKIRVVRAAFRAIASASVVGAFVGGNAAMAASPADYFRITVVDDQTGRGVPLVELRTVNEIRFVTDSAGIAAIGDPDLLGQNVYFHISSPGYEYEADGFKYRGKSIKLTAGGSITLKMHRTNVAELLYRITGGGIYNDSVLTGQPTPIKQPLLNGLVFGQDTVEVTPYHGKLYWFYGDTNKPSYPLGQFATSGATSTLPGKGGLDPSVGIDLTYWVDSEGFSKKMIPLPNAHGPIWVGGLFTLTEGGQEHLYTHYAEVDGSMKPTVSGLAMFDDAKAEFTSIHQYALGEPLIPEGHPFFATVGGKRYIYFGMTAMGAFPLTRTVADQAHVVDPTQFEGFTCLVPGTRYHGAETQLERGTDGKLIWAWKANTPPLGEDQTQTLVKAGKMRADEALLQLRDIETDRVVLSHGGSVYWNPYRSRWIQITTEVNGSPGFLGEMWFSEADTPVGPWTYARHIVTHDHYTFYNPTQDPFFDQNGGKSIYFEGTYVNTFSDVKDLTPRYNYNQLMYRLSLDDRRLSLPEPVYQMAASTTGIGSWAMREQVAAKRAWHQVEAIPFYAVPASRPHDGMVSFAVTASGDLGPGDDQNALFYGLPANASGAAVKSAAVVPLYAYRDAASGRHRYSTDANLPGLTRSSEAVCLVWRNPSSVVAFDGDAIPVSPTPQPPPSSE